jgi:hypothetical protein
MDPGRTPTNAKTLAEPPNPGLNCSRGSPVVGAWGSSIHGVNSQAPMSEPSARFGTVGSSYGRSRPRWSGARCAGGTLVDGRASPAEGVRRRGSSGVGQRSQPRVQAASVPGQVAFEPESSRGLDQVASPGIQGTAAIVRSVVGQAIPGENGIAQDESSLVLDSRRHDLRPVADDRAGLDRGVAEVREGAAGAARGFRVVATGGVSADRAVRETQLAGVGDGTTAAAGGAVAAQGAALDDEPPVPPVADGPTLLARRVVPYGTLLPTGRTRDSRGRRRCRHCCCGCRTAPTAGSRN